VVSLPCDLENEEDLQLPGVPTTNPLLGLQRIFPKSESCSLDAAELEEAAETEGGRGTGRGRCCN
jgi:hypothetical protein